MRFIDLFCGIGGFRIALQYFGFQCVFSSEIDKYAQQTYSENFGEVPYGDITKIKNEEIPPHDIICAGFPCQPFSVSGLQKGFEDSRGTLFFEIARIASYHKPKILFLENVSNLKKHADGETIKHMISILENIGYSVFYEVLNASDFGVPQSRKRLYFVAFRKDLNITDFNFPAPSYEDVVLEDILLKDSETQKYVINREDIVINKKDSFERLNKTIRIGTINKGGQGDRIYSSKGHAITLSAQGGGSGSKTGAYLINGKVRKLSPIECRAVQGFPSTYKISVSDSQAWKQFGNSVAVPVIVKIVEKIITIINR
ncbi:MAG: DNA cytosine methyltransferase [Fusobacteriaceae bacterium]